MNILEISHMFPDEKNPTWGIFIFQHVKSIKDFCKYNISVVAPRPFVPRWLVKFFPRWNKYLLEHDGIEIDEIKTHYLRYFLPPTKIIKKEYWTLGIETHTMAFSLGYSLNKFIHNSEFLPDILHAHTAVPDCWAAIKIGKRFGKPVICSFRGSDINRYPMYNRMVYNEVRYSIQNADLIVTVSEALKRATLGIAQPKRDIEVVYNGVDIKKFKFSISDRKKIREKLRISDRHTVLLHVSNISSNKGVFETLEAFKILYNHTNDIRLIFVGDGEDFLSLKSKIKKYGLENVVFMVGSKKHDEIPGWMSAADIFVFPTYYEGLPNVVLEAMAVGLPIIASKVGGIPEVVKDGVNGFLIEPKNVKALVDSLKFLLSGRRGKFFSENSQKIISEKFTWKRHAQRMCELYEILS